MVATGIAKDITRINMTQADELRKKELYLTQVGYSCGVYGCNGQLWKGKNTGTLYAITNRTQAIFLY
jgi:hypothetical protein